MLTTKTQKSNGKSYMDNFKIQNYILEIVKPFYCLGVTIGYNGNINAASFLLMGNE